MKSFLVIYDRLSGEVAVEQFDDPAEAMVARMAYEARRKPNEEVVVLSSDSEKSLQLTHSRYFKSVAEILRSSGSAIRAGIATAH